MNKKALYDFSYGVYVLTSKDGERNVGCVANSAMQITSLNPTVAVSVNHDNFTNGCIKKSGLFALSILPESFPAEIIGTFGFKSGRDTDKFDGVKSFEKNGVAVLADAKSYIVCKVEDALETETHTVFLGRVVEADVLSDEAPMTYDYYHRVIKGKAPKNAPTYRGEENSSAKDKWRCTICGYETEADELPDGFTCPICGVSKDLFKKS